MSLSEASENLQLIKCIWRMS